MSPVDAIAVEVVVEAASACSDRARAQAALADALASARAPKRGSGTSWRVLVDVEEENRTKTATARIVDDRGTLVAERTVSDRTACASLAKAVGAWASLVLDDELARAHDAADPAPPSARGDFADAVPKVVLSRGDWRTPDDPDYVPPKLARPWTLEIGFMGYVRDGLASTSGFAGGSMFTAFEVSPGWFVRPSVFLGKSTVQVALDDSYASAFVHAGTRADFCRRIPGNYIERRGLELDLCAGGDLSSVRGEAMDGKRAGATRLALGPSASFRGEIGDTTNLEVRLASGFNFLRDAMLQEERVAMVYAQAEVGVSWRFR